MKQTLIWTYDIYHMTLWNLQLIFFCHQGRAWFVLVLSGFLETKSRLLKPWTNHPHPKPRGRFIGFRIGQRWTRQWTNFTKPRMHLFHTPQCFIRNRNVHIYVLNGALWDIQQVHSGNCELGQFVLSTDHSWVNMDKLFIFTRAKWIKLKKFHNFSKKYFYKTIF